MNNHLNILDVFDEDDHDEEIIEFVEYERRPYIVRVRENLFESFDDQDFFTRFRLTKSTCLMVLAMIDAELETATDRNHSISPLNQLLLALGFYATGSFLRVISDTIKVSKSSASKIIKRVSTAIARLLPTFIYMPRTEPEIREAKISFYNKARLPRVIGSIDCTHIRIQSPGGNNAELFRNRKGYFSINVQTISSTDLKILDIVARWPGSTHDQIIFDNSAIKARLENNEFGNSLLVADSGYANTNHVITPLLQAQTKVQQMYNEAGELVTRTRNPVERQYGVLKRRFPVLQLGLRLKMETTLTVIVATAVLHNIALQQNDDLPPPDPEIVFDNINFDEDINIEPVENNNFANARDFLLDDYFPHLLVNQNM